jgi:O-antigen/teichoic acid export membrane protein
MRFPDRQKRDAQSVMNPKMSCAKTNLQLTSGDLLARNVVWNLLGACAPLAVAVPAVPLLLHRMGTDRFGVLTLAWSVIGYFGLFDFGFGRALTKLVAERLGAGRNADVAPLFWTSLFLMLLFGLLGAIVMAALAPRLVYSALRIPRAIEAETLRAFYLLAASLPILIVSAALRGFLEAHQRFRASTAVRVPLGIFTFAGPLLVLPFTSSVLPVVAVLALARLAATVALGVLCLRAHPGLGEGVAIRTSLVPELARFGGWMTVSNVVSPMMVSLDRFLIGALVSISAVAYYAAPAEAVTKLLFFSSALAGVVFPALSSAIAQDKARARMIFLRAVKYTFLAMFPVVLLTVAFAREGLTLWVGAAFSEHSAVILRWLAVGVFFSSLAQIPFSLIQAMGRPDFTARLHLLEVPVYAALLWFLVKGRGIEGAAIAWTARTAVDAAILFGLSWSWLETGKREVRRFIAPVVAAIALFVLGAFPMDGLSKKIYVASTLCAFAYTAWFGLLDPGERTYARALYPRVLYLRMKVGASWIGPPWIGP